MKRRRIISLVAWTVAVTTALILARCGIIPAWIFYVLLIALHIMIFTRIGIGIYHAIKIHNEKKNRSR